MGTERRCGGVAIQVSLSLPHRTASRPPPPTAPWSFYRGGGAAVKTDPSAVKTEPPEARGLN